MKIRLFSAIVLFGALSACASKRAHYDTPALPLPAAFRHTASPADDPARARAPLQRVLPDWWRLLNNPELDQLIDRALAHNRELRLADLRVTQAQARVEQARADQLPALSLPYSANIAAPAEGVGLRLPGAELTSKRTYQANLRADWRPDLWGEVAAMYESAELQLWRASLARDDLQRALVANVVSLYASYLSLCDRLRIAQESETLLSDLLNSVRDRMQNGDATMIEYEQQRSAVFQVRATIPQLLQQRELAQNRLATLLGTLPQALQLGERGLDSLSTPVVSPGLPAALLLQRPDVRALEATMLAADANIDAARARLLPALDINAQAGVGGFQFSQLLKPGALFWSGLAQLSTVIFDGGKRAQEVTLARAVHEELTETYAQTLYNAVREVEDAQASLAWVGKRLGLQQESVAAALQAWTFSRESYEAGAIDYMVLLDTERTYHARLDEFNRIRLEQMLALVELFQALGGGVDSVGPLPGTDARAVAAANEAGLVQGVLPPPSAAPPLAPARLVDGYGKRWLAELTGVASLASAQAARRDLLARFPQLVAPPRLLLLRQDHGAKGPARYRLFVGAFDDQAAAQAFCAALQAQFLRCRSLLNNEASLAAHGRWLQVAGGE